MKIVQFFAFAAISLVISQANAAPVTYVCDYKTYSDDTGLHEVGESFVLTFLLDASTNKAYFIGNNGSAEVRLLAQEDGFTLVEITAVGNVMVTVITQDGTSVHSRTGILFGEIGPSQYYGTCKTNDA